MAAASPTRALSCTGAWNIAGTSGVLSAMCGGGVNNNMHRDDSMFVADEDS